MFEFALIGTALVAVTVTIHAIGTSAWVEYLGRRFADQSGHWNIRWPLVALMTTAWVAIFLHVVQVVVWALAYLFIVPEGELDTFEVAVYFSFVTFTTLGYGDITLSEGWRLLSGIQALNGILLVGWTSALIFTVVQRIWQQKSSQPDLRQ